MDSVNRFFFALADRNRRFSAACQGGETTSFQNWYCDHHDDASGQNVPYYSYLFAYKLDLAPAAQPIKLPDNPNVRILPISVAEENPELRPVQPLYDVLPPRASNQ